ncbi:MAG: hypothetical protein RMA76_23105 [Deltaproteobacteria bacterium]|jgi:hypothetical protein
MHTAYGQTFIPGQTPLPPVDPTPIQPPTTQPDDCRAIPLDVRGWSTSANLTIHEATTCRYRATWNVRASNRYGTWPRDYDFKADAKGWISDVFIRGNDRVRVRWNLRTDAVEVASNDGRAMNADRALRMARFAKATVFPGIDLGQLAY